MSEEARIRSVYKAILKAKCTHNVFALLDETVVGRVRELPTGAPQTMNQGRKGRGRQDDAGQRLKVQTSSTRFEKHEQDRART